MSLALHGFAVVKFTYRLVPEFTFPAAIQDTDCVCRWVLYHAEEYGFDSCNVFAVGGAAGAQILGLYCAALTDVQLKVIVVWHLR